MIKKIITTSVSLFISAICFAQTQMEMNQKAFADYKKADTKMTVLYKKVQKVITDSKEKTLLFEAQRTWIKFKEAHCKSAAADEEGGSIYPLIYATCLKQVTEDRILQLNEYLKNN